MLRWLEWLLTPKPRPGPRMDDLRIQDHSYGDTRLRTRPWSRDPRELDMIELCIDLNCPHRGRHERHEPGRENIEMGSRGGGKTSKAEFRDYLRSPPPTEQPFINGVHPVYVCPFGEHWPKYWGETVWCAADNCPIAGLAMDYRAWNAREPHSDLVKHITRGEPIFVIRAQDALSQPTVQHWLKLAELTVNTDKFLRASIDFQAILEWQRRNGTMVKIPD